jgi:hypothetical protein
MDNIKGAFERFKDFETPKAKVKVKPTFKVRLNRNHNPITFKDLSDQINVLQRRVAYVTSRLSKLVQTKGERLVEMALESLTVRRGPNPAAATKRENTIQDWDSLFYSLWLEEMALNPGFYSDVKGGS